MGLRFEVCLECEKENSKRNRFICRLDDDSCYIHLKNWKDLYDSGLSTISCNNSLKLDEMTYGWYLPFSWNLNKIVPKIKSMQRKLRTSKKLELPEKEELKKVINDLQMLYDLSMEQCTKHKLDPERCYVVWWISY
jgi:hypothetical protein